jgi:hypothetical protein
MECGTWINETVVPFTSSVPKRMPLLLLKESNSLKFYQIFEKKLTFMSPNRFSMKILHDYSIDIYFVP